MPGDFDGLMFCVLPRRNGQEGGKVGARGKKEKTVVRTGTLFLLNSKWTPQLLNPNLALSIIADGRLADLNQI